MKLTWREKIFLNRMKKKLTEKEFDILLYTMYDDDPSFDGLVEICLSHRKKSLAE